MFPPGEADIRPCLVLTPGFESIPRFPQLLSHLPHTLTPTLSDTMDTEMALKNHQAKSSPQDDTAMPSLTTIPTSVTLSAEQFEKLYLSPLTQRQGMLSKQMGNPTPLYLPTLDTSIHGTD